MSLFFVSVLSLLAAVACAQPQTVPARATRAITLVGNNIYLYGGSGTGGNCYSDFYSLHLDPSNGWVAGSAPWNNINQGTNPGPAFGTNAWAVGSTDGSTLLFYGQTLCPQQLAQDPNSAHTYTSSSASVQFQNKNGAWTQSATANNVLGPRSVKDDEPVPVQVVDTQNQIAYTFVYDPFNPQLGMQLWSFSTNGAPTNIATAKNTTMVTTQPPTPPPPALPANGTNVTTPVTPPTPVQVVLAPFIDAGSAVFVSGTIVVIGGGKVAGTPLTGDNVDPASGWYKMDRCWIYTIATNEWKVQSLTAAGNNFPLPRRLAALAVVGTKIYMHGGNTTQTVPTDTYAKDMWILDTQSWQWTAGPNSGNGRAYHTLVNFQNTLLAISGYEFQTTTTRAAQNAFPMMYDTSASTWGTQFGTITQSFFQQHAAIIIGGSVAGFVFIVVLASIIARLCRKRSGRGPASRRFPGVPDPVSGLGIHRKRSNKPFLTSSAARKSDALPTHASTAAASRLSGMTLAQTPGAGRGLETEIDLSAISRPSESTVYDQYQYPPQYNPYASVQKQQQVPLMSANALEQQGHELDPYHDDDDNGFKDVRPLSHAAPHSGGAGGVSQVGGYTYPGQMAVVPGIPTRPQGATRSDSDLSTLRG